MLQNSWRILAETKNGLGGLQRSSVAVVIGFVDGALIVLDLWWSGLAKDDEGILE